MNTTQPLDKLFGMSIDEKMPEDLEPQSRFTHPPIILQGGLPAKVVHNFKSLHNTDLTGCSFEDFIKTIDGSKEMTNYSQHDLEYDMRTGLSYYSDPCPQYEFCSIGFIGISKALSNIYVKMTYIHAVGMSDMVSKIMLTDFHGIPRREAVELIKNRPALVSSFAKACHRFQDDHESMITKGIGLGLVLNEPVSVIADAKLSPDEITYFQKASDRADLIELLPRSSKKAALERGFDL